MDRDKEIGERIKQRRQVMNLTARELADEIAPELSPDARRKKVQRLELGDSPLDPATLIEVARVLDVSEHWIVHGGDLTDPLAELARRLDDVVPRLERLERRLQEPG